MREQLAKLALQMFKQEWIETKKQNDELKRKIMTERLIHLYIGIEKDLEIAELEAKTKELKIA